MSFFVNILIHPLDEATDSDLGLLVMAAGIVRDTPLRGLSVEGVEHVEGLNDFIMELARLANCAIWKAKRGLR